MTKDQKIFGIGLNKTGTSSLHGCFHALRLMPVASPSSSGYNPGKLTDQIINHGDYNASLQVAIQYRTFEDRPWNVWEMYKHLDERFPGSKFILTERNSEKWWKSVERWITIVKPHIKELYQQHLQSPSLDKVDMINAYISYNDRVKKYFNNGDQLLVMNMEEGDGWEKLCSFLDKPIPIIRFPHANKQAYSQLDLIEKKQRRFKRRGLLCMDCGEVLRGKKNSLNAKRIKEGKRLLMEQVAAGSIRKLKDQIDLKRKGSRNSRVARIKKNHPTLTLDDFAIVTCFFNPAGYNSRVRNFHTFYKGVQAAGVKLLTVELAFDDQDYQLGDDIGEVIRLRSSDVMWHKERLLNVGIQELLRRGYKKIAWLDCDIVFDDVHEWPWYVANELERANLCQVFSHSSIAMDANSSRQVAWGAIRYYNATKNILKQSLKKPKKNMPIGIPQGLSGFGWAARSEVLEKVLLYDGAILGGGDKMIYAAAFRNVFDNSKIDTLTRSHYSCDSCGHYNESIPYKEHYQSWARQWCDAVNGLSGFVYTGVRDLYHGERKLRGYMQRRETLFAHDYDPKTDIVLDENGCWKWSSDKPDLHKDIANYFLSRNEDQ
ncbi:MAG: sulfotransferase [Cyclobacteriaceae bacterium]